MRWSGVLLPLILVLLSAPAAAQTPVTSCSRECDPKDPDVNGPESRTEGPVRVVLYAHHGDPSTNAYLNTEKPTSAGQSSSGGFPLSTNACTTLSWVVSAGQVRYEPDGWRTHQEPGLSSDLRVQTSGAVLYVYLTQTDGADAAPPANLTVEINSGRFEGKGTRYASGSFQSTPTALPPGPGAVWEYRVPLMILETLWGSAEAKQGFSAHLRLCDVRLGPEGASSREWRMVSTPNFPSRILFGIENPMETREESTVVMQGELFIRWSFVSAWGSYDIDDASLRLVSGGARGGIDPEAIEFVVLKRSVDHDGHFNPVNATWKTNLTELPPGSYEFRVSITNLQGTFRLSETIPYQNFSFEGDDIQVPFPSAPAILLLIAFGLWVAKRRETR